MTSFVPLANSAQSLLPNSQRLGPINPSEMVDLTIVVRSTGDLAALEKRVHEEALKAPGDRVYLSREEVAAQYGASEADLELVERYAKDHGLTSQRGPAARHRSISWPNFWLAALVGGVVAEEARLSLPPRAPLLVPRLFGLLFRAGPAGPSLPRSP